MDNVLKDETGNKFGKLTAIKIAGYTKSNAVKWLCKCDCGKETIVRGQYLRDGNTKSCGCSRNDAAIKRRLVFGLASIRQSIIRYKNSAKKRGYEYTLTEEQFKEITQQDCYYCGAKPSNIHKSPIGNGDYIYNGIDRVDNNKGYTIENIVPCCGICNQAKHKLTLQEFKDWIKKVYSNMEKKI